MHIPSERTVAQYIYHKRDRKWDFFYKEKPKGQGKDKGVTGLYFFVNQH